MTEHKTGRARHPKSETPVLAADRFPTLEVFFSGYLHEDYIEEHGSPQEALRAFRLDASPEELLRFEEEARLFLLAIESKAFPTVTHFLRAELSSAWQPESPEALRSLLSGARVRV